MSNLVHVNPQSLTPMAQVMTLADKMEFCKVLSGSEMLPARYINKPGNIMVAVEYANALQLPAIVAMMEIYFVQNQPCMSAKLMNALGRRAGHQIKIDSDKTQATVTITRSDSPSTPYRAQFTMADAERAKLTSKEVWRYYGENMLINRAISNCAKIAIPDALMGICYTPEEMGDDGQIEKFTGGPTAVALPTQDPGFKAISAPAPKPKAKKPETKPEPVADTGAAECPDAVEAEVTISEPAQTVEVKAVEVFGAPAPEPAPPPSNTGQKAKLWREMRRVFGSKAESDGMAWLRAYCSVAKLPLMTNGMPDVDNLDLSGFEDAMFALIDREQAMKDADPSDDSECPI